MKAPRVLAAEAKGRSLFATVNVNGRVYSCRTFRHPLSAEPRIEAYLTRRSSSGGFYVDREYGWAHEATRKLILGVLLPLTPKAS